MEVLFYIGVLLGLVLVIAGSLIDKGSSRQPTIVVEPQPLIPEKTKERPMPATASIFVDGEEIELPGSWSQEGIEQTLERYETRPNIVSKYVDALKERFVLNQDAKTVQRRTEFLKIRLEHIKTAKDFANEFYAVELLETEQEIRRLELEARKKTAENTVREQKELAELRTQLEKLKLEVEIAQQRRTLEGIQKPPEPPPPEPTKEEQQKKREEERLAQKAHWGKKIRDLQTDKVNQMAATMDANQRKEVENIFDDKIAEATEQWKKYLL